MRPSSTNRTSVFTWTLGYAARSRETAPQWVVAGPLEETELREDEGPRAHGHAQLVPGGHLPHPGHPGLAAGEAARVATGEHEDVRRRSIVHRVVGADRENALAEHRPFVAATV